MAARCETVLNTTMPRWKPITPKVEDFATMTKEHLDGEINFYEQVIDVVVYRHPRSHLMMLKQVITKLRNARQAFDFPQYDQLANLLANRPYTNASLRIRVS